MTSFDRVARSRRRLRGSVATALLFLICCALAPAVIGVAGALAVSLEFATIAASAIAVALYLRHRRLCRAREGC